MASFLAKLGSFDFSDYVRVAPGDGLDPYSASVEEPAFTEALGDGHPLVSVDVRNREMAWPLYLNAADKDALHDLARQAVLACRQEKPITLQWRDAGASNITYYDVTFARFEPAYNFRQGEHGWMAGVLRVWCAPPYGHTGTDVVVGTATAAANIPWVASVGVPTVGGDVPAFVGATVYSPTRTLSAYAPMYSWVSVVPSGWRLVTPAASLLLSGATLVGASGAGGSQVVRAPAASGQVAVVSVPVSLPSVHRGVNRFLVLAKAAATGPGVHFSAIGNHDSRPLGPTVTLAATLANEWQLLDVGVIDVDPLLTAGNAVTIGAVLSFSHASNASVAVDINAVFTLPDDRTALTVDHRSSRVAGGAVELLPSNIQHTHAYQGYPGRTLRLGNQELSYAVGGPPILDAQRRGAIPRVTPSAAEALCVGMIHTGRTAQAPPVSVSVAVREQFTFAR